MLTLRLKSVRLLIAATTALLLGGCIGDTVGERLATDIPAETVTPAYWMDKPGPSITARDYDKLFSACQAALRRNYFVLDRAEYRAGVLTSQPLISSQFFEFWRSDVPGWRDRTDSSIATYRRTVRFELAAQPDGTWQCKAKVLVERQSLVGSRATNALQPQTSFNPPVTEGLSFDSPVGPPPIAWLATARDAQLERDMLEYIGDALH